MLSFDDWFSSRHGAIPVASAKAVLALSEGGATLPFIARYRKEQTGNLDEVAIQNVLDAKQAWDAIEHRKKFICEEIDQQGKLTPELKEKILATYDLDRLEDLYLPYKLKRKTKAMVAREAGLEPLADWMWRVSHEEGGGEVPLAEKAAAFVAPDKNVATPEQAIEGARDIVIERLAEDADLREHVRRAMFDEGFVRTTKGEKAKPNSKFERYFAYHERVSALLAPEASHRFLAMRRGFMEEELVMTIGGAPGDEAFDATLLATFERAACPLPSSPAASVMKRAARLALRVYVASSIENEVKKALRDVADAAAIHVFAENLRKLLLASPYGAKSVLGVDPGIRTGCKLAVVSESGAYVGSHVIYLGSDREREQAKQVLRLAVESANVSSVAVGNGTAGREAEAFIRTALGELGQGRIPVVMVSEAGASVYSASDIAREEFPDLDLTIRGAISIARRLQDPLAELVKVDPKSIGVGQYQHDVTPGLLKKSLETVVQSCVNAVGVNVNTASPYLLAEVAGIGSSLARAVVEHRQKKGVFKEKRDLLAVSRLSDKVFEQAAGFLRIPGAAHPLDNTGIHPERYPLLEKLAARLGKDVGDLVGEGATFVKRDAQFRAEVGQFTFDDIVKELERPGRDPRESFVVWSFRDDIHELKDLTPGMVCPGIVTNVTNFGAFVDIGVHQDGLVHISQLADRFVKDPRDVVSPGGRVTVRVLEVNLAKNQIALTMKSGQGARPSARQDGARPQDRGGRGPAPGAGATLSSGALKNDALRQLEQFRPGLKRS
ncbi:MAG TPA: Tex family protein [Polyangiaceae bacterium]|nr:Tex family protein [Polyangiaceae bacterium]